MGAVLVCVDCSKAAAVVVEEFDDLPIAEWWASKGERCADCRRKAAAARSRPDVTRRKPGVLVAHRDSGTQVAGARAGLPTAGTRRREVYDVITAAGELGLTFEQLGEVLNRSYSHVGPRVRELVRDGLVERAPYQRAASSGARQDVWRVCALDKVGVE